MSSAISLPSATTHMHTVQNSAVQREFVQIKGASPQMNDLTRIFNEILEPLYGSQVDALRKIGLGTDRICYLLYEGRLPVGVIQLKTTLSNEFAEYGIKNSIEIKSLFVVNSTNNSGKGLGTILMNRVFEEAANLKLGHEFLHLTVSLPKKDSLTFFQNKMFKVVHAWPGKYKDGVIEFLLACAFKDQPNQQAKPGMPRELSLQSKKITTLMEKKVGEEDEKKASSSLQFSKERLATVDDVHWDDVHALRLLSDGSFISGSKDNTLKKWDFNGNLLKVVQEAEPLGYDDKDWITSLGVLNDEYWLSGERNGRVNLWTTSGDYVKEVTPKLPKTPHYSDKNNTRRVNCMSAGLNKNKPTIFVGFPTLFDEFNLIENRNVASTRVHSQDWVYCVQPIQESKVLVVRAGEIELWRRGQTSSWVLDNVLMHEPKETAKTHYKGRVINSRTHISCLVPLESSKNQFGFGSFDGSVKVLDAEQKKVVRSWKEHKDKVWTIDNVSREVFTTSGEDGVIRLWDVRVDKSVSAFEDKVGPIYSLLRLTSQLLVAAATASRVGTSSTYKHTSAQFLFHDIRMS